MATGSNPWKPTLILAGLFSLTACGGGGTYFIPAPQTGVQANESIAPLQVFLEGESQALVSLRGQTGEDLFLEVRGAPTGTTPNWSSSNVFLGNFIAPGQLRLQNVGEFEIRVWAGGMRAKVPVTVGAITPDIHINVPPPDPEESEEPPAEEAPNSSEGAIPPPVSSDPFVDEVVKFNPGPFAGFGSEDFPDVVLGPPYGGGNFQSGLDVLSLGVGGEITLMSDTPILNGPGVDFIVFENPFLIGGDPANPFAEPAQVAVSQDGVEFFAFPCEPDNQLELYPICAGVHPVYANAETNSLDPTDPEEAGGDPFDLEVLGLSWIQYIRIQDLSTSGAGSSAGFDLDAISIRYQ